MKKKDLIVGTWYRQIDKNNVFGKLQSLKDLTNDYFPCKEYISNTRYYNTGNYFSSWSFNNLVKVELSEIFDYLPDGHLDKIKPIKVIDDLGPLTKLLENIK